MKVGSKEWYDQSAKKLNLFVLWSQTKRNATVIKGFGFTCAEVQRGLERFAQIMKLYSVPREHHKTELERLIKEHDNQDYSEWSLDMERKLQYYKYLINQILEESPELGPVMLKRYCVIKNVK